MEEIAGHAGTGKRLSELLGRPCGRRMSGDVDVDDAPAIMGQDQEDVEDLEPDGRHGKEIHGNQLGQVVFQERAPRLRRRSPVPHHVLADAGLADVNAQLQQFTVNARRAQSGFSWLMRRISCLTSRERVGLPGRPRRPFHVQNNRKPLRCQAVTVAGLTITRAVRQSPHIRDSAAQ